MAAYNVSFLIKLFQHFLYLNFIEKIQFYIVLLLLLIFFLYIDIYN